MSIDQDQPAVTPFPQEFPAGQFPPSPAPKKKHGKRNALIVVGAVVVIAAGASAGAKKDTAGTALPAAETAVSTSVSTAPSTTPPASAVAPTSAAAVAAVSTPSPTPTPPPAPVVVAPVVMPDEVHTGTGDDIVTLTSGIGDPRILKFECPKCSSNTVVKTNGDESLVVNEIGAVTGRYLIDIYTGSNTSEVEVQATGKWTLTIQDRSAATTGTNSVTGKGADVVKFTSSGTKAAITYAGKSNFVVKGFGGTRSELAVNEIAAYSGTVRLTTPGLVQVQADPAGSWSITTS